MKAATDNAGIELPEGACDCHVHVFDPVVHPYVATRSYTPPPASLDALRQVHAALGIDRLVLIQPSVYGTDNACLLAALNAIGPAHARGVAVVDLDRVGMAELERLHAAGVRGVRLNLAVRAERDIGAIRASLAAARRLAALPGWCLQIHAPLALIAALGDELAAVGVPIVLDHYAGATGLDGADSSAIDAICALMSAGIAYVKLSAPYRVTQAEPGRADVAALARRFFGAAPGQLVWGSDWPHTGGGGGGRKDPQAIEPFRSEDNARALAQLRASLPDEGALTRVLVDNAARLYGFAPIPL